jgi:putative transposase
MARHPRKKSNSGVYHVIVKGANKQEIFHDEEDRIKFLDTLQKYKRKSGLKLYAWCLKGNHIHLLIKEGSESISVVMKRIGVSYANYYNWKYKTTGHLFQDRFMYRWTCPSDLSCGYLSSIE